MRVVLIDTLISLIDHLILISCYHLLIILISGIQSCLFNQKVSLLFAGPEKKRFAEQSCDFVRTVGETGTEKMKSFSWRTTGSAQ